MFHIIASLWSRLKSVTKNSFKLVGHSFKSLENILSVYGKYEWSDAVAR